MFLTTVVMMIPRPTAAATTIAEMIAHSIADAPSWRVLTASQVCATHHGVGEEQAWQVEHSHRVPFGRRVRYLLYDGLGARTPAVVAGKSAGPAGVPIAHSGGRSTTRRVDDPSGRMVHHKGRIVGHKGRIVGHNGRMVHHDGRMVHHEGRMVRS